jgi:transcription factor SPN1
MSDGGSPLGSPAEAGRHHDDEPRVDDVDLSDHESELSEIDEDQFEDYDPTTARVEERPINIDETAAKSLKASKRKATDGVATKKPKEKRREKKRRDSDDDIVGDVTEGKRQRKSRPDGERRAKQRTPPPEVNEEDLTPEERRQRALDRAMEAAVKQPSKRRRRKDEEDLEEATDEQIANLKIQMERACEADVEARNQERPAVNKIRLLPQVVSILNRNDIQQTVLDPETNFLQAVKFFLEPLNDGSLPAFNIQRDIYTALMKLPIQKDVLISSGIGKVVLFYTRSKRVEPSIKRMAEKLLGEWSRPILKRTDDYKKRMIETREYDQRYVQSPSPSIQDVPFATKTNVYLQRCQAIRPGRKPVHSHTAPGRLAVPLRGREGARARTRRREPEPREARRPAAGVHSGAQEHLRPSGSGRRLPSDRSGRYGGVPEDGTAEQDEEVGGLARRRDGEPPPQPVQFNHRFTARQRLDVGKVFPCNKISRYRTSADVHRHHAKVTAYPTYPLHVTSLRRNTTTGAQTRHMIYTTPLLDFPACSFPPHRFRCPRVMSWCSLMM